MPRPKMKRILASTICSTELMPDKIAIVRNHPAPRRMRKIIGTRGSCAAGRADAPGRAPLGLSDILVLLRGKWTFAENHLAMQGEPLAHQCEVLCPTSKWPLKRLVQLTRNRRAEYASLIPREKPAKGSYTLSRDV